MHAVHDRGQRVGYQGSHVCAAPPCAVLVRFTQALTAWWREYFNRCECISEARAKDLHADDANTKRIIGFVLLGLSVPIMVYLVVRHEHVVENRSCIGPGTHLNSTPARCFCYFMHFWIWPVGMLAGSVVLLVLGYDVDDGFYDGCCGNGYDSCVP
jgi:hypothetical protein